MADMQWFEVLRHRRRLLNLTQHQLAKIAKVDYPTLANIETGRRKLSNDGIAEDLWEALRRVAKERGVKFVGMDLQKIPEKEKPATTETFQDFKPFAKYAALSAVLAGEDPARIRERLEKTFKQAIERKRQLLALENLKSIDDPIISEIIESFRREIEEKDAILAQLEELVRKADTE